MNVSSPTHEAKHIGYILPVGETDRIRLDALGELFNPISMDWLSSNCTLKQGKILDVGCGNGCLTRLFAKTFPEAQVVGVDMSDEQIAVSRKGALDEKLTNCHWLVCDVYHLDELNKTHPELFDIIHCRFVLSHLQDPIKAVDQMLSQLKTGGHLFLEEIGAKFNFQYPSTTIKALEAWKKMADWKQAMQNAHQNTAEVILDHLSKSDAISSWGSRLYDISIEGCVKKSFFRMGAEHGVKKIEELKMAETIKTFGYSDSATWLKEMLDFEADDSITAIGKNFEWIVAQKK
jgi:2-polyprenyl-3-methyl-5-hydroxy-6-metoxy-1,4-benzoquinol methylase